MFNLDEAVKQWLRSFRRHRAYDEAALREMEQHLWDHLDDLTGEGMAPEEAFAIATASFGEVDQVADEEFLNIKRTTTFRSIIFTQMFSNYFKTTLRALMKYPVSSFINLSGLSVAIGVCLVAFAFYRYAYKVDDFHELRKELFLVTHLVDDQNKVIQEGTSPGPLGQMLKAELPQVEEICRLYELNVVLQHDEQTVFYENTSFVDPSFLTLFTFPLKWGTVSSLEDPNSIILSEERSVKYFGNENPLGKTLTMLAKSGETKTFEVTGVAAKFPGAHNLDFGSLVNIQNLEVMNPGLNLSNPALKMTATILHIPDRTQVAATEAFANQQIPLFEESNHEWKISSFSLEVIDGMYERSTEMRNNIIKGNFVIIRNIMITFVVLGIFVMLLASTNYINIAIVSASRRLKEIGMRKVIGASRSMIILQFMQENLVMMVIALVIGLLLGTSLFVPWLEETIAFDMDFTLMDPTIWWFFLIVLLVTGLVSGLYPALFISGFQVASIFRGKFAIGNRGWLTKLFLGFQIMLACIIISVAVLFTQNNQYQRERNWGYEKTGVMYAYVPVADKAKVLKTRMEQNPDVMMVSGTENHLGRSHSEIQLQLPDGELDVREMQVADNYFETMGLELVQGRPFLQSGTSDQLSIVVNESLVKKMGWKAPLNEVVKLEGESLRVVGVVKDFHLYSFFTEITPLLFRVNDVKNMRFVALRAREGKTQEVLADLKEQYFDLLPNVPFSGGYQEDVWGSFYDSLNYGSDFWQVFAVMVLLLAALGLYGLVALNISGRKKEFSIRKVLGAGYQEFTVILLKQYAYVFVISFIAGTVIAYFVTELIFSSFYSYYMPINISFSSYSGGILALSIGVVIGYHIWKTNAVNPSSGLNSE